MNAVTFPVLPRAGLAALTVLATTLATAVPAPVRASALFAAAEVDQQNFLLVAAPIGTRGDKAQLNIYEQLKPVRPCFEVGAGLPSPVNPLLATFDFTGICNRYIDANGYSVRVGGQDLATSYRLMVTRSGGDMLLLAFPTKAGAGPEMVVARTRGSAAGFLKLHLEPGWRLMRRQFGGRNLGHLYVYADSWPGTAATAAQPATMPPAQPAAATGTPAPATTGRPATPATTATPAAAAPISRPAASVPSTRPAAAGRRVMPSTTRPTAVPPATEPAPAAAQQPVAPPAIPATKL
ncbi:DUF3747 domain-containing protein [Cyanobium gracile]|uniref:DUF3747 domain-containing protein n=1 Tax=Cyanobium gracile (strain ATCC 27147 / PCC 6307) TaxID=292564 RepID=K9P6A9_CYAGP|nr:Protein of unknown function (DUF3747) [Cyanobium gracile PCC 6307]